MHDPSPMAYVDTSATRPDDTLSMAADIVSAYVTHNSLPAADLPGFIATVHRSLLSIGSTPIEEGKPKKEPAVPIKKSVTDEYIICLEDGKKFQTLRRHLLTKYNMTPEQYREKWGLPSNYPMTCSSYSFKRSSLAKAFGLGAPRKAADFKLKTSKASSKKAA